MRLVFYPDPVLLTPAARIDRITDEVRAKAAAMVPFMKLEGGVGLAAPQVGWGVSLLLASEDGEPDTTRVLLNPRIVRTGGIEEWGEEGCLSFPGIHGEVQRWTEISVEATGLDGAPLRVDAEDFFARVLQHEIDHLEGRLFIDRMRASDREKNRELLKDLVAAYGRSSGAAEVNR